MAAVAPVHVVVSGTMNVAALWAAVAAAGVEVVVQFVRCTPSRPSRFVPFLRDVGSVLGRIGGGSRSCLRVDYWDSACLPRSRRCGRLIGRLRIGRRGLLRLCLVMLMG